MRASARGSLRGDNFLNSRSEDTELPFGAPLG
jgi:hypothetical protein